MRERFAYRMTKDEYVLGLSALTDQLARQDAGRTRRILELLAVFVVVLAVVSVVLPDALLGMLVAALLFAIAPALLRARWSRSATGLSYDPAVADHEVELDDDGIAVRSPVAERRWSWAAVRRIHELEQAIVIELAGWDMVVLPGRLWPTSDGRRAFLDAVHGSAPHRLSTESRRTPTSLDSRDLLTTGAIAAAVDVLALIVFAIPTYHGPGAPAGSIAFVAMYAAMLLLGVALAYGAYRLTKPALARLHDWSPAAAVALAQLLVWAVPLYILASYFGLI